MSNRTFKFNVMVVKPNKNNENTSSSLYMVESSNLWHGRPGHVNYDSLRRLINLEHRLGY